MRGAVRVIVVVALAATLLVAGGHFVYYLYVWEWVRAQIAGVVFLAALIVAGIRLVLSRLDQLEEAILARPEGRPGATGPSPVTSSPQPSAVDEDGSLATGRDFAWLSRDLSPPRFGAVVAPLLAGAAQLAPVAPRTSVFIPVILGAGLAVSAVAGLVERTSAATYGRRGPTSTATGRRSASTSHPPPRRAAALLAVAAVLAALATALTWQLVHHFPADLPQGTTELTVQVDTKTVPRPADTTVEVLGRYCTASAISGVTVESVRALSASTAVLVVSPVLDETSQRRLAGCLQDGQIERHRLTVISTGRHLDAGSR